MNELVTPKKTTKSFVDIMNGLVKHSEHQMEKEIEVNYCPKRKVLEYIQKKSYRIPDEIYASWPKFYAIEIEKNDRSIVTLSFRNNANLDNIINLLQMADALYEVQDFTELQNTKLKILTIRSNTDRALVYLLNKYNEFSTEATSHLWEVYRAVIENSMDNKNPKWKTFLSLSIDAWEDEEDIPIELKCNIENNSINPDFSNYLTEIDNCKIKSIYSALSSADRIIFKSAVYDHYIFNEALNFAAFTIENYIYYNPFEYSLSSNIKGTAFITNNFPIYQYYILELHSNAEKIFSERFEPTFFEKLFDSKKWDKHLKSANSLSKSGLSIVDRFILASRYSKTLSKLSLLFDGASIITSLFYFKKEFSNGKSSSNEITLDEKELGKDLITIDFICDSKSYTLFSESSIRKILEFYADFSKFKLDKEPEITLNNNFAFYILQNITDVEYLKSTSFYESAKNIFLQKEGQTLSLLEYLKSKNLSKCIETTNTILRGKDIKTLNNTDSQLNIDDKEIIAQVSDNEDSRNITYYNDSYCPVNYTEWYIEVLGISIREDNS